MKVDLSGKTILITGGTGTLGRAFVERASQEGAVVYFTYHQNVDEAKRLETLGAKGFQIDLTQSAQIDALKKQISALTRHLDALVHNAAVVRDHMIQNMTDEEWDEVIFLDLKAAYYLTKKFLSFLFKKPGSKILNIISRVGIRGGFGEANYAAAKGGLIALTKTLAQELGRKEISVNALNPGFMKSHMTESIPQEVFERNIKESVLEKMSDPIEVSNFMIYLLSDQVRGVSGQVFHFESRKV